MEEEEGERGTDGQSTMEDGGEKDVDGGVGRGRRKGR